MGGRCDRCGAPDSPSGQVPSYLTDRGTLAHIARTLTIPPHVLGITGPDDADFAAMLAFGTSMIRLAQIAGAAAAPPKRSASCGR